MDTLGEKTLWDAVYRRVEGDASAANIADALVAVWREIFSALDPILGLQGMAALYARSVYVTGTSHSWMSNLSSLNPGPVDFGPLFNVFAQQSSFDAMRGGEVLLTTFQELLASLIGPALTQRLLRSLWSNPSSPSLEQDNSK